MFDFHVNKEQDKNTLTISGELTIQHAAALHEALLSALEDADTLVLNLENVTGADLSCLQLLYSAYTTVDKRDKCFRLSGNCPEVFREAAREAGYLSDAGCGAHCDKGCIWVKNGNDCQ